MARADRVHVAIHAALDPRVAGGAQTSLVSLTRALKAQAHSVAAVLVGPPSVRDPLVQLTRPVFDVHTWQYSFPWYRGEAGDSSAGVLAALERERARPAHRAAAAERDTALREAGAEVIHFPYQVAFDSDLPTIYEPWDLQHMRLPEMFTEGERAWRTDLFQRACGRATLVVTATRTVKSDLVELLNVPAEKILVIPRDSRRIEAPDGSVRAHTLAKFGIKTPFALFPAQTFAHKNHVALFQALALLRDRDGVVIPLVCSGRQYQAHWAPIERALKAHALDGQVQFVGGVSEEELSALFSSARMLVFPSLFEGLGLPVLEAMQFDIPIAAANTSCLPEVIGAAGLLFDPLDPAAMAAAIRRVWSDESLRADLVAAGRARRQAISWDEAAKTYIAAYRFVAGRSLSEAERALVDRGVMA